MIGIGIVSHVLNVLPFAYFLITPFANGRGGFHGNETGAVYKDYYRKYWQKLFFGRHVKITLTTLGLYHMVQSYRLGYFNDKKSWEFFAVFESLGGEYDEEYSPSAKEALIKFKKEQLLRRNYIGLAHDKANISYKLKAEVFDEYIAKQSI